MVLNEIEDHYIEKGLDVREASEIMCDDEDREEVITDSPGSDTTAALVLPSVTQISTPQKATKRGDTLHEAILQLLEENRATNIKLETELRNVSYQLHATQDQLRSVEDELAELKTEFNSCKEVLNRVDDKITAKKRKYDDMQLNDSKVRVILVGRK